jgi:glutaredoxin-related protein
VFVGGELVGGCDDTLAAYRSGTLEKLLKAAGVQL